MALFCPIMAMFFSKKVFYIFWKLCLVVGIILKQYLTPLFELYGSASTLSLNFSQKTTKNQLKWPFLSKNGNVFPKNKFSFHSRSWPLLGVSFWTIIWLPGLKYLAGPQLLNSNFRQKSTNMAISGTPRCGYAGPEDTFWYPINHIKRPFPTPENVQVRD